MTPPPANTPTRSHRIGDRRGQSERVYTSGWWQLEERAEPLVWGELASADPAFQISFLVRGQHGWFEIEPDLACAIARSGAAIRFSFVNENA